MKLIPILSIVTLLSTISACGSMPDMKIPNPFKSGAKELSGKPENATEYICEGNKRFFVRMLNNGNDAWLIYPDHEVNLSKASSGNRYTSGVITLEINGDATTLNDGEKIAYTGCKPQTKN